MTVTDVLSGSHHQSQVSVDSDDDFRSVVCLIKGVRLLWGPLNAGFTVYWYILNISAFL